MSKITKVCFVRHGQTDWNLEGRIQGQTDIPLNDRGRLEAERVANRMMLEQWDVCYSSDLMRARDTAISIQKHSDQINLVFDDRLRERNYGLIEGLEPSERDARFGVNWRDKMDELEVEPKKELIKRMVSWTNEIQCKHQGQNILVVTHGGWIRAYFIHLFHHLPDSWLSNGSVSIIHFFENDWRCDIYNDFTHIRPLKIGESNRL